MAHLSSVGHPAPGVPSPVNVVGLPVATTETPVPEAVAELVVLVPLAKGAAKDVEARERRTTAAKLKDILRKCVTVD